MPSKNQLLFLLVFFIICLFSISLISAYIFFFFNFLWAEFAYFFPASWDENLNDGFSNFFWYICYDFPSKHCFSYIPLFDLLQFNYHFA